MANQLIGPTFAGLEKLVAAVDLIIYLKIRSPVVFIRGIA